MTQATRPMASTQRKIIGRANLVDVPGTPEVDVIARARDLMTGETFYVIAGSNGGAPFGVWPSELRNLAFCMPLEG